MCYKINFVCILCTDKSCPTINFENGKMEKNGNVFNFSCENGYELQGTTFIGCNSTSKLYNDSLPECVGKKNLYDIYILLLMKFLFVFSCHVQLIHMNVHVHHLPLSIYFYIVSGDHMLFQCTNLR